MMYPVMQFVSFQLIDCFRKKAVFIVRWECADSTYWQWRVLSLMNTLKHLEFFSYSINVYVLIYMYYRSLGKIIELCLNMTLGLYFWYFTQCVTSLGNLFLPHIFQLIYQELCTNWFWPLNWKFNGICKRILDGTIYFVIALFHRSLIMMASFNMNFMYSDNVHLFIPLIWPFHTFKEVKTIPWQKLLQLR